MFICGGGGGGFEQFLRFTIFGLKINQIVDYTLQTYSATTAHSAPILQGHFVGYMFCKKFLKQETLTGILRRKSQQRKLQIKSQ